MNRPSRGRKAPDDQLSFAMPGVHDIAQRRLRDSPPYSFGTFVETVLSGPVGESAG